MQLKIYTCPCKICHQELSILNFIMINLPEDGEDGVVGGEGNGNAEAGRHEKKQEEGRPPAKPIFEFKFKL